MWGIWLCEYVYVEYGSDSGGVWNIALKVGLWNLALRVGVVEFGSEGGGCGI